MLKGDQGYLKGMLHVGAGRGWQRPGKQEEQSLSRNSLAPPWQRGQGNEASETEVLPSCQSCSSRLRKCHHDHHPYLREKMEPKSDGRGNRREKNGVLRVSSKGTRKGGGDSLTPAP